VSGIEAALTALLRREWILTTRPTINGLVLVAHRPVGWEGPDPSEELIASTPTEMRSLLIRHQTKETK